MTNVYIPILIILTVGMLVYSIVTKVSTKKVMKRLDKMIEAAIEGDFKEEDYSEEEISFLECKFANYLNASNVSKNGLTQEKEHIKSMISDISHQSKTPIANILLYSELLEEEELSESGKKSVEAIHSQTEKLRFLVDALVKLSRLESGIVLLTAEDGSVNDLIKDVLEELEHKAEEKGLVLTGPKEEKEVLAHFDFKWTSEALHNIVDNAIKYTEKGAVTIALSETDVFARIDIKDTGIGISEEESAKIFSRFYRSTRVAQKEGVGLGLYLAREILTNEGGYMKVISKEGEGSTFSVFLPKNK